MSKNEELVQQVLDGMADVLVAELTERGIDGQAASAAAEGAIEWLTIVYGGQQIYVPRASPRGRRMRDAILQGRELQAIKDDPAARAALARRLRVSERHLRRLAAAAAKDT